jgi:4a-hydroxytetrahydrobiopterin dehydratase
MTALLSPEEIQQSLNDLPEWRLDGNSIIANYTFRDFSDALIFVNTVGQEAEQVNHHPDIDIRYNKVKMLLTSHDSGGITRRDIRMAKRISDIYQSSKRADLN